MTEQPVDAAGDPIPQPDPTQTKGGVPPRVAAPTVCRIVRYVGKQGVHAIRPAIVTVDRDTYVEHDEGVPLDSTHHVHLWVFTTKSRTAHEAGEPGLPGFHEMNVPYSADMLPGTWHWPPRSA
jgi:hypothetical protein